MLMYQSEQVILAERREKLLREAEMRRLARQAARQPARIRHGWLRLRVTMLTPKQRRLPCGLNLGRVRL